MKIENKKLDKIIDLVLNYVDVEVERDKSAKFYAIPYLEGLDRDLVKEKIIELIGDE